MTPGQVCSSLGVSLLKRLLAVMFLVVVSGQFCDARPDDQQQTVKLSQTHPKIRLEPTIIQAKLPYSFWSLMGLMHPHGSLFPCFQLIIWEQPLSFSQNQSKCPPPVHLFIYIDNVQICELLHINITARLKPVDSVAFINKKQNKTKHCTPFFFSTTEKAVHVTGHVRHNVFIVLKDALGQCKLSHVRLFTLLRKRSERTIRHENQFSCYGGLSGH